MKHLDNHQYRFDELEKLKIDESKRPAPLINDEVLGFHGNFKKLNVDWDYIDFALPTTANSGQIFFIISRLGRVGGGYQVGLCPDSKSSHVILRN